MALVPCDVDNWDDWVTVTPDCRATLVAAVAATTTLTESVALALPSETLNPKT